MANKTLPNVIHFRLCRKHLAIVLLCSSVPSYAQLKDSVSSYHIIGLEFGLNQIKEDNLHPKVQAGTRTVISYSFEKRKKIWHQYHFDIGYSRLKTKLEDISKSANLSLDIDYSWNYPLVSKKNFRYYLGPEAKISYSASFFPNWDESHLYWADHYAIGFRNSFSVQLKNKKDWTLFVSFPLLSVFSRPELYRLYKIDDTDFIGIVHNLNSNLSAAGPANVFYIKLQTEYRFPVYEYKRQSFTFSLRYTSIRHKDGNPFTQLSYLVGIKLFL